MYPAPGYGYPGMAGFGAPPVMVFIMTPQGMMQVPASDPSLVMYGQYLMPAVAAAVPVPALAPHPPVPAPAPSTEADWGDFQQSDGPQPRCIGSLPMGSSLFAQARSGSPPAASFVA